jgi:hypothetical protein
VRPTTVLQDEEKCIFMKSATEYGKSAPNGCFCRTKKNVIYENGCSCKKQKNVFFESATVIAVFTTLKLSADCA